MDGTGIQGMTAPFDPEKAGTLLEGLGAQAGNRLQVLAGGKGPVFIPQQAVRLMASSRGGAIVNVASINGVQPVPMQGIYSITKAGLISMTKAYAKELACKNIRVNYLKQPVSFTYN